MFKYITVGRVLNVYIANRLRSRDFEEIAFFIAFVLRDLDHTHDCACTYATRPASQGANSTPR